MSRPEGRLNGGRPPARPKLAKNISLDVDLWEAIAATAAAQGRSMAGFIAYTMRVACGAPVPTLGVGGGAGGGAGFQYNPRAVALAPHDGGASRGRGRQRVAAAAEPEAPRMTKQQREWKDRLDARVRLVQLDESLGKYSEWWIVAGRAAVDITTDDFGDYIAAGAVVERPLPRWLSDTEAQDWLREQQRAGLDFAWVFVTGDCESRIEQYNVETAARLRVTPGVPVETLEAMSFRESQETVERAAYGTTAGIVELAAARLQVLRADAALRGEPVQMPTSLLAIVSRARTVGWRPAVAALPLMLPGLGR